MDTLTVFKNRQTNPIRPFPATRILSKPVRVQKVRIDLNERATGPAHDCTGDGFWAWQTSSVIAATKGVVFVP